MARIYVAGSYTADTPAAVLENVHAAIDAGLALIDRGHTPYIPQLTHWVEQYALTAYGQGLPYEFYLAYDREWLRLCDAVLLVAASPGADREVWLAERMGLPVYRGLAEVPQ
jgi:hypothetical protein